MSMSNKIREILVNLFMVEDAAGLDYIKDKVAKRTEEIIFHAECEKSLWTLTCTVSKAFCL